MQLVIQIVKNVLLLENTTYAQSVAVEITSKGLLAILPVQQVIMVILKIPVILFVVNVLQNAQVVLVLK